MSTIWTIGYEQLLPPELVAELEAAGVQRVIDVRFRPQSRRPGMSKTRLGQLLGDHGIAYENRRALGTPADIRFLFHAGQIEEARRRVSRARRASTPRTRSTARRPSSSTGRGPRCCAWRPTPRSATAACSPTHCKPAVPTSAWSISRPSTSLHDLDRNPRLGDALISGVCPRIGVGGTRSASASV